MKKMLFAAGFFLLLMGIAIPCHAQQKSGLEGTWSLEKVVIVKNHNDGSSSEITYNQDMNKTVVGIYDVLKFDKTHCSTTLDIEVRSEYKFQDNILFLNFSTIPNEYEVDLNLLKQNQLCLLHKVYSIPGVDSNENCNYSIKLTYKK